MLSSEILLLAHAIVLLLLILVACVSSLSTRLLLAVLAIQTAGTLAMLAAVYPGP